MNINEVTRRQYWNHYFKVVISKPRTWVRWGYTSNGSKAKPDHVVPKMVRMQIDGMSLDFPFKVPKGFDSDGVKYTPKVCDEVVKWGWKFCSICGTSGEWEPAESMEECLAKAMKSFKSQGLIPDGFQITDEDGNYEDVPMTPEWQEFQKDAFAAVDSWQHHKGWPKGWKE